MWEGTEGGMDGGGLDGVGIDGVEGGRVRQREGRDVDGR